MIITKQFDLVSSTEFLKETFQVIVFSLVPSFQQVFRNSKDISLYMHFILEK
jgi:hypothetical protein